MPLMVTVPALVHRLRGTSLSYGPPVMDLGKWGIPVNLVAVVMGGLLVVNIAWPRESLAPPDAPAYQVWAAPIVLTAIALAGLAYLVAARPHRRLP